MDRPLVSVIMGVYNEKNREQLELAIDSILTQTLEELELIICDDGSEPSCREMLRQICPGMTGFGCIAMRQIRAWRRRLIPASPMPEGSILPGWTGMTFPSLRDCIGSGNIWKIIRLMRWWGAARI